MKTLTKIVTFDINEEAEDKAELFNAEILDLQIQAGVMEKKRLTDSPEEPYKAFIWALENDKIQMDLILFLAYTAYEGMVVGKL